MSRRRLTVDDGRRNGGLRSLRCIEQSLVFRRLRLTLTRFDVHVRGRRGICMIVSSRARRRAIDLWLSSLVCVRR